MEQKTGCVALNALLASTKGRRCRAGCATAAELLWCCAVCVLESGCSIRGLRRGGRPGGDIQRG
jgi:hypothetical protein